MIGYHSSQPTLCLVAIPTLGTFYSWEGSPVPRLHCLIQVSPIPLKVPNWREFLTAHPDQEFVSYIYSRLLGSFEIGFDHHSVSPWPFMQNHPSAHMNDAVVQDYILATANWWAHFSVLTCNASLIGLVPMS